jgi:antitoxin YobK
MPNENDIVKALKKLMGRDSYFGPVSQEAIHSAEAELGTPFPNSYKLFLANFGAGAIGPYDLYGIPDCRSTDEDTPEWSHVVDVTLMARRSSRGAIPNSHVAISSDGGDYNFYLDTSRLSNGECPVVALGPGADDVVVAPDLLAFCQKLASGERLL